MTIGVANLVFGEGINDFNESNPIVLVWTDRIGD